MYHVYHGNSFPCLFHRSLVQDTRRTDCRSEFCFGIGGHFRQSVILDGSVAILTRMNSGSLYVSFWKVGLPNLPEGIFRRRRLSFDEAKALIEEARQRDALMCVCDEDLLAPYYKRAREKHEELRDVLSEHFGIHLTIDDFTHKHESEEGNSYHVAPLATAKVGDEGRLLVITCYYVKEKRPTGRMPPFEIDPESVEFIIFESANAVQGFDCDGLANRLVDVESPFGADASRLPALSGSRS